MDIQPIKDLKVGDRVIAINSNGNKIYSGLCVHIEKDGRKASIKRDDNKHGGGYFIDGHGSTWNISRMRDNTWNPDGGEYLIYESISDWESYLA